MSDFREICELVCEIAREAGEYIAGERKTFRPEDIRFKGRHNLVSYVDKTAEGMIVSALRELIPDSGFITEEGTADNSGSEKYKWIIDPLDGTTNFIHGLPPYCVSIALMEDTEIVVGVVYEVTLGEMFYAWKDSDAYLDGRIIKVSNVTSLENSLIAVGFSYDAFASDEKYLSLLGWYQRNSDGIRRIGSSTADLVYVACGRFDAFAQIGLSPWDVAAGGFIARQAGAVVCNNKGGRDYIFGREVVACTPGIFEEFIKTME